MVTSYCFLLQSLRSRCQPVMPVAYLSHKLVYSVAMEPTKPQSKSYKEILRKTFMGGLRPLFMASCGRCDIKKQR